MLNLFQISLESPPFGVRRLFFNLFFGFVSAFVGIMPPGLINMTATKVNHKEGKSTALWFILGVLVIICFQVFFSVLFAKVINNRPDVVILLRSIGLFFFTVLTFYFLLIAKKSSGKNKKLKQYSSTSRFFLGILLSSLNVFPIPYYVFVTISLASMNLFSFTAVSIITFVLGTLLGSFFAFYLYISFFAKYENKRDYLFLNINTIIGCITGIMSILTLISLL